MSIFDFFLAGAEGPRRPCSSQKREGGESLLRARVGWGREKQVRGARKPPDFRRGLRNILRNMRNIAEHGEFSMFRKDSQMIQGYYKTLRNMRNIGRGFTRMGDFYFLGRMKAEKIFLCIGGRKGIQCSACSAGMHEPFGIICLLACGTCRGPMFRRCSADVPQGPACSAGRGKAGLLVHLGLPPSRLGSRSFPYRWDMPSSHCCGPGRWLLLALPPPLPDFIGGPGLGGAGGGVRGVRPCAA